MLNLAQAESICFLSTVTGRRSRHRSRTPGREAAASRQALAGKSVERQDPSALRQARDGKSGNDSFLPVVFSEAEAKPNRWIDRAPIEVAIRQAAIDLGEHQPGVSIKLLRKLPIDDERNGVERPVAVCERAALAAQLTGAPKAGWS
jgi:hypothetical protein